MSELIYRALAILNGGCMTRVELVERLGVHRNTWSRHQQRGVDAGLIACVGPRKIRGLQRAPRAAQTAQPPPASSIESAPSEPRHVGIQELQAALAEAQALVRKLEALLDGASMPTSAPSAIESAPSEPRTAPASASSAPQTAPAMVQTAPASAPTAPKPVQNVVQFSRTRAGFLAKPLVHPALRQAGQARTCARETPPTSLKRTMKEFRRTWRHAWRERFPELPSIPEAHALLNRRTFEQFGMNELSADEFRERLERFFADPKAAHQRWPVGFFFAGLNEEYAEMSVEEPRPHPTRKPAQAAAIVTPYPASKIYHDVLHRPISDDPAIREMEMTLAW